ncbi:MAG: sulfurtransferase complex subunit TusD [Buchnera aphidicola (Floraphis choui)]
MSYTLLVTGPPYGTQNASTALLFSRAIFTSNYKLLSVFFHFDGVLNANKLISFSSDEYNLIEKWVDLNKTFGVKLNVCISAAYRRGIVKNQVYNEFSRSISTLKSSFHLTGFSELARYIEKSDRIIQF